MPYNNNFLLIFLGKKRNTTWTTIIIFVPTVIAIILVIPRPNTLSQTQTQHAKKSSSRFRRRASFVVVVGVQFPRSVDWNGLLLGSVFLFGSSTQTQPFLLLIFFISCLVGEKVVEKSRNRREDDRQPKICRFSLCFVNFLYFLFLYVFLGNQTNPV